MSILPPPPAPSPTCRCAGFPLLLLHLPLPSLPSPVDTQASPSDLHSVVHQVIGQSPCIAQVTRSQVLRVRRGEGVVDGNVPASKSVNTCVGDGAGAEPQVSAHNGLQTQSPPHCADCSSVPLSTLASSSPSLLSPPLTSSPRPYYPPPPPLTSSPPRQTQTWGSRPPTAATAAPP